MRKVQHYQRWLSSTGDFQDRPAKFFQRVLIQVFVFRPERNDGYVALPGNLWSPMIRHIALWPADIMPRPQKKDPGRGNAAPSILIAGSRVSTLELRTTKETIFQYPNKCRFRPNDDFCGNATLMSPP